MTRPVAPVEVTGETITDEQIREWEAAVCDAGSSDEKRYAVDLATVALSPLAKAKDFEAFAPLLERAGRDQVREANARRREARSKIAGLINDRDRQVTGPGGDNPITDEQIEAERDAAYDRGDIYTVRLCDTAENESGSVIGDIAREKVAAAYNARHAGGAS